MEGRNEEDGEAEEHSLGRVEECNGHLRSA